MKRAELKLNKTQVTNLAKNTTLKAQNTAGGHSCKKCDSGSVCITGAVTDIITGITY